MATQLVDTRAFDGCQEVKVYRGQEDADRVVLVEQWDSPANHQAYMAWRTETGALAALADVLAAEPTFTYFDFQPHV
jgi:quinol monooxygenase YgiN